MDKRYETAIREGFRLFSAEERLVLELAVEREEPIDKLVMDLCFARRRAAQRAASDRETDHLRRLLVGARIPRPLAEKYRAAAKTSGRSLYRFVLDALEREYLTQSNICSIMNGGSTVEGGMLSCVSDR